MQGAPRKIIQAVLYEAIAVACVAPVLALTFEEGMAESAGLALTLSAMALFWNMVFNTLFEYWEARQTSRERTFWRRVLHALGFEGGLVLMMVPVVAWWLQISLWAALVTDLAMFAFFFFYAFVFQWGFDKVFDLPDSARACAPANQ